MHFGPALDDRQSEGRMMLYEFRSASTVRVQVRSLRLFQSRDGLELVDGGMKGSAMIHFRDSTRYMTNKRNLLERMVWDCGEQPVRSLASGLDTCFVCNRFGSCNAGTTGQKHRELWLALPLSLFRSLLHAKRRAGHIQSKGEAWWTRIFWGARC